VSGPAAEVLVLFGATGDLARKMLWPALYRLGERGKLTVPVVGVALTDQDIDQLRSHVAASVRAALGDGVDQAALESLLRRVHLLAGDFADADTFDRLAKLLAELVGAQAFAVHYLAVPPGLFVTVADGLAAAGLAEQARLAVEKPFGRDLASARQLNARLRRHFDEDRLFRVDH
jgi:glucose-6-phosphate 1-dehydrogenase